MRYKRDITEVFREKAHHLSVVQEDDGDKISNSSVNVSFFDDMRKSIVDIHLFIVEEISSYIASSHFLFSEFSVHKVEGIVNQAQSNINQCQNNINQLTELIRLKIKDEKSTFYLHYETILEHLQSLLKEEKDLLKKSTKTIMNELNEDHLDLFNSLQLSNSSSMLKNIPFKKKKQEKKIDSSYYLPAKEIAQSDVQLKQLEKENKNLLYELDTLDQNVKNIETQLYSISSAQDLIAENIARQQDDIDQIRNLNATAINSAHRGNTNLLHTNDSGKDFRLFLIVLLLFLSGSLLFLHFYNP